MLLAWPAGRGPHRCTDVATFDRSVAVHACGAACDLLDTSHSRRIVASAVAALVSRLRAEGAGASTALADPCADGGIGQRTHGLRASVSDRRSGRLLAARRRHRQHGSRTTGRKHAQRRHAGRPRSGDGLDRRARAGGGLAVDERRLRQRRPFAVDRFDHRPGHDRRAGPTWKGPIMDYATIASREDRHHHRPALPHLDQLARRGADVLRSRRRPHG